MKVDMNFLIRGNFLWSSVVYNTSKGRAAKSTDTVWRESNPLCQGDIESVPSFSETLSAFLYSEVDLEEPKISMP
jgi:hypothetical protein